MFRPSPLSQRRDFSEAACRLRSLPWCGAVAWILLSWGNPVPAAAPPPVRLDQHGRPLPAGARARLGASRWRVWGSVGFEGSPLVVSRDLRLLASAGIGPGVSVFLVATGRKQQELGAGVAPLGPLAFSPDGRRLATLDKKGGVVRVWNLADGKQAQVVRVPLKDPKVDYYLRAAFPPGNRLATWDGRRQVILWDLSSGKPVRRDDCRSMDGPASFSPDGRLFCTQTAQDCLTLLDLETGRLRLLRRPSAFGSRLHFVWSADCRQLALVRRDSEETTVLDLKTGRSLRVPPTAASGRCPVAFSPDGRTLANPVEGTSIELIDLSSGQVRTTLDTRQPLSRRPSYTANVLYRDERQLLLVEADGFVRTFDVRTGKELDSRRGHMAAVTGLDFTADGRTLVSLGNDGTLRCWDVKRGRQRDLLAVPEGFEGGALSVSANGRWAALIGDTDAPPVAIIDLVRRRVACQLPEAPRFGGRAPPFGLNPPAQLSRDGTQFGVPCESPDPDKGSYRLEVRQTPGGRLLHQFDRTEEGVYAFSPDSRFLVMEWPRASWTGVELIDLVTGNTAARFAEKSPPEDGKVFTVAFAPDGRRLAVADLSHVYVWEVASRSLIEKAPLPADFLPWRMVITPGGRILVPAVKGLGTLQPARTLIWSVWDLNTRTIVKAVRSEAYLAAAASSADGRTLALAQNDSSILLCDVPSLPERKVHRAVKEDLTGLWADLASGDAGLAWRSLHRLIVSGSVAVPFLSRNLSPAKGKLSEKVLADLESEDYTVRQAAVRTLTEGLRRGDREVEQALLDLLHRKPSLEVHQRVERLLKQHSRPVKYTPEELRHIRAVAVLEQIGGPEALALLKKLAAGAPAVLTREARAALKRLQGR
jgi:WD40 repeat protein